MNRKIRSISRVHGLGDGTRAGVWEGTQKLPPRPDHLWAHPASSPLGTGNKSPAGASETLVPSYNAIIRGPNVWNLQMLYIQKLFPCKPSLFPCCHPPLPTFSLTRCLSVSLSLSHSSRLAVPRWWLPRCCHVYPRYWSGSEGHVTTDRTRTLCLIPQCSCAKNTSLLHLSYFILYYLVLWSVLLLQGQRSRWLTPYV